MSDIATDGVNFDSPGLFAHSVSRGKWHWANHLAELDRHLLDAATTPNARVIIELPPRHGKSQLTSIYYPAWYRLRFPERNVMSWSATGRLAQRFSTHVREIVSQFAALDESTKSWEHWKLAGTGPNEGEFYAAGVGGASTMGAGFHMGIVDDFFGNVEDALSETMRDKLKEWFLTSCITRAEPGASLAIICTRWHRDDLIGFVLKEAEQSGEKWQRIRMPAINDDGESLWPERWPIEKLDRIKRRYEISGYPWMWEALYQQRPPDVLDSEWDPAYFHDGIYFEKWPEESKIQYRLMQLDPSVGESEKADYQAYIMMAIDTDGELWIDADILRLDIYAQVNHAIKLCRDFGAQALGVETNAFQKVLEPLFREKAKEQGFAVPLWGSTTTEKKIDKIRAEVTPYLAQGLLHFRKHSPGVNLLMEQLRGFPGHKYKDGPDGLAMCIQLARQIWESGPIAEIDGIPDVAIAG